MTDGTSIFGVDTARYQPIGTYDPGAFSIVNFEDPQLEVKARARAAARIAWGVYLWVYPGHDVNVDAQHMVDVVRALGLGDPPAGFWFDYEDAGITPDQLHSGFVGLDAKSARGGYYSGPSALDHTGFLDRPWWNAAYPTGEIPFPGYGALWASSRPRPMGLWQYTSAGGLDRDVVVDETWWAQFTGGTPAPVPSPIDREDDIMLAHTSDDNGTTVQWYRDAGGILVKIEPLVAVGLGALDPNVRRIDLGGTLGAVAWNAATVEARKANGI